ncbi:PAAR domain-containing protein [Pseudomonas nitroreducens]|uniref:PAAR domain-containing protein n=1 Tax=Pseudomonas TaxID=286 RepID=UPI0002ED31AC|nr:PAAR domain-containing protein [Pseudomonas nitroreducens]
MDAQAAARLGDEIAHGFGVAAMVAGAVAGALIGAAVVAATAATGGLAAVIIAGSVAAGGLSMFQIVKGLTTIFELPEPTTGVLIRGSLNVYVNSRNAMRAGDDVSSNCTGLPLNHPMWPFPVLIAEGSATVYINGKPAARLQSKMVCGAHIKTGSKNTFIGGPTERVAFVLDLEEWLHTGLEALGIVAALGGLVLAAMAGLAALGTFVVVGGLIMGGMELLGQLGDRLGPGYRDLLQGVAGMALLGLSPKMARLGREPTAWELRQNAFKPGVTENDILALPHGKRPPPTDYLKDSYVKQHLEVFEKEGGSFLFTPGDIADPMYTTFNPKKFVMARSDMDAVVAKYRESGDVAVLEDALGYKKGDLVGKDIYRVNIDNPKVVMPSGNEGGANSLWRPGGVTYPGGNREAVLDNVPIAHGNDLSILSSTQDVTRIP